MSENQTEKKDSKPLSQIKVGDFTLDFAVAPLQFNIERKYSFEVEPCLGQTHPLVHFQHGSVRTLTFSINIDEDVEENINLEGIKKFLLKINEVDPETRSTPEVTVVLGPTEFKGYVSNYRYIPLRFDQNLNPSSIKFDLEVISSEEQK